MKRTAFWSSLSVLLLGAATLPACAQQDSFDSVMADCSGTIPARAVNACLERVRALDETSPSPQLQSLEAQLSRRAELMQERRGDGAAQQGYAQSNPPPGYGNPQGGGYQGPDYGSDNQGPPASGYGPPDQGPPVDTGANDPGPPPGYDQNQDTSRDEQPPTDEQSGPDDQPPPYDTTGPDDQPVPTDGPGPGYDEPPPDGYTGGNGPPPDNTPPPDDTSPHP